MRYADLHMHTRFSSDGMDELGDMCEAVLRRGMDGAAFTEHYDALPPGHVELPYELDSLYYDQHDAAARRAVMDARERYNGRLQISYAVELGQPHTDPEASRALLASHDYDFVLGSIHVDGTGLDYYRVDFTALDIPQMFRDYYAEHLRMIEFGGIDSIAHLDYPVRKMERFLEKPAGMWAYRDCVAEVVRAAAKNGIAMEINTRGLHSWFGRVSPEPWVLELYRDFGGSYVTTGSDAHNIRDAAYGIREAASLAESLGFRVAYGYVNHTPLFE